MPLTRTASQFLELQPAIPTLIIGLLAVIVLWLLFERHGG
jgi:hypothetical protein